MILGIHRDSETINVSIFVFHTIPCAGDIVRFDVKKYELPRYLGK